MASILEPRPEMRMTMFFIAAFYQVRRSSPRKSGVTPAQPCRGRFCSHRGILPTHARKNSVMPAKGRGNRWRALARSDNLSAIIVRAPEGSGGLPAVIRRVSNVRSSCAATSCGRYRDGRSAQGETPGPSAIARAGSTRVQQQEGIALTGE